MLRSPLIVTLLLKVVIPVYTESPPTFRSDSVVTPLTFRVLS